MRRDDLIAFSMCTASYIVENFTGIRNIILFGSIARGKFDKESDIDIFIDIPKYSIATENKLKKIIEKFKKTELFEKWKLKGLDKKIKLITGNLRTKEWENLYLSICSDGILLYGKYTSTPASLNQYMIFSYGNVKNIKKRVNLHRHLFGYKIGTKYYRGLVDIVSGKKLGHGVFIAPIEETQKIRKIFEKQNIPVKLFEVWTY